MLGNIDFWFVPRLSAILFNDDNRESRANLSAVMMDYWGNFAHGGDPNGGGLPTWQAWSNADGATKAIVFDTNPADKQPLISEDKQVWTIDTVLAAFDANVAKPLRAELLAALRSLGWLTGVE